MIHECAFLATFWISLFLKVYYKILNRRHVCLISTSSDPAIVCEVRSGKLSLI